MDSAAGLTAAGLKGLHAAVERHVGDGKVPGLVALVACGGQQDPAQSIAVIQPSAPRCRNHRSTFGHSGSISSHSPSSTSHGLRCATPGLPQ